MKGLKLKLKISRSSPSSSSAQASPLPSPAIPSPQAGTPSSPTPKHGAKPSLAEKGKALLRLPSLSRSRSRSCGSSPSPSPLSPLRAPPSPLSDMQPSSSSTPSPLSPLRPPPSPIVDMQPSSSSTPAGAQSAAPIHGQTSPEPHIDEMRRVFEKFDMNGDGKISAEELQHVLTALGDNITREEAELIIADADMDEDGFIDMQEFIDLNMRGRSGIGGGSAPAEGAAAAAADELAAAFNMFDLHKNGCITPKDLHRVLSNLGNHNSTLEDCKRMICNVDQKGCGYVDFDDFKVMMTRRNSSIMA